MKSSSRLLATLIFIVSAFSALAGKPVKHFEALSGNNTLCNYNYISPTMLRMMGDTYLNSSSNRYQNLPIQCKDITSIESIAFETNADEELWNIIKKIKKEKNMQTLITKQSDSYRYDVLVTLNKDGKKILNMLVIAQNGSYGVDVIYMEGKIPVESIQNSFF